jgi:hypothetical protein
MAYIGNQPFTQGIGLFSQDTFTGDGSTTTFDLANAAPDGGGNDIQVFIDNVRQQEGASNAYTLGFDGSSELKRITFTAAPAAAAAIYVLNPGTKNVQQISTVSDNTVTTAKLQSNAITTAKITDANVTTAKIAADAINATKIADDAISEEHLDVTAITGQTELAETAADNDVLLIYDTSATTIKKIQKQYVGVNINTTTALAEEPASGDKILIYDTTAGANKAVEYQYINPTLTYTNGTATGDGSTTAFTINSGRSVSDVVVTVNGLIFVPTTDYTISGTTLTFATAPGSGNEISFRYLPISGAASYTNTTATGDGSTVGFTITAGRTVEDLIVTINGVLMTPTDDYSVSGTTLTFVTAPAASAEISIRLLRLN